MRASVTSAVRIACRTSSWRWIARVCLAALLALAPAASAVLMAAASAEASAGGQVALPCLTHAGDYHGDHAVPDTGSTVDPAKPGHSCTMPCHALCVAVTAPTLIVPERSLALAEAPDVSGEGLSPETPPRPPRG